MMNYKSLSISVSVEDDQLLLDLQRLRDVRGMNPNGPNLLQLVRVIFLRRCYMFIYIHGGKAFGFCALSPVESEVL